MSKSLLKRCIPLINIETGLINGKLIEPKNIARIMMMAERYTLYGEFGSATTLRALPPQINPSNVAINLTDFRFDNTPEGIVLCANVSVNPHFLPATCREIILNSLNEGNGSEHLRPRFFEDDKGHPWILTWDYLVVEDDALSVVRVGPGAEDQETIKGN